LYAENLLESAKHLFIQKYAYVRVEMNDKHFEHLQ